MANPESALIEAIAETLYGFDCQADGLSPDLATMAAEVWSEDADIREIYFGKAHAAYAAMVEHLGLIRVVTPADAKPGADDIGAPELPRLCPDQTP